MSEENEKTKVQLHKQEPSGLVHSETPGKPLEEKQEDPEELTSEDFKKAADDAQEKLSHVAQSAQQGVADVLESIHQSLLPDKDNQQDPEVKDFRAKAAEAAAEAQAYMKPTSATELEKKCELQSTESKQ